MVKPIKPKGGKAPLPEVDDGRLDGQKWRHTPGAEADLQAFNDPPAGLLLRRIPSRRPKSPEQMVGSKGLAKRWAWVARSRASRTMCCRRCPGQGGTTAGSPGGDAGCADRPSPRGPGAEIAGDHATARQSLIPSLLTLLEESMYNPNYQRIKGELSLILQIKSGSWPNGMKLGRTHAVWPGISRMLEPPSISCMYG